MAFKKGTPVRQVLPAPVEGMVTGYMVDAESGETLHRVEWLQDGTIVSRYFKECQIEATE